MRRYYFDSIKSIACHTNKPLLSSPKIGAHSTRTCLTMQLASSEFVATEKDSDGFELPLRMYFVV